MKEEEMDKMCIFPTEQKTDAFERLEDSFL